MPKIIKKYPRFYFPHDLEIIELKDRFWKNVENVSFATDEDCWLWIGYTNNQGYGLINFGKRMYLVHRISWWIYRDLCQSNFLKNQDLCALHKCDSSRCINPGHLFLGSKADNNEDKVNKGRHHNMLKTHCNYGHKFTPENTRINVRGARECKKCCNERSREHFLYTL